MALATRDASLYADLAGIFREQGIPTLSLLPGDRIPSRVAAVLTSPAEAPQLRHPRLLVVRPPWDPTSILAAVAEALLGNRAAPELILGVDPGPRPGFAVLSGGSCLIRGALEAPEEVGLLGRRLRHQFPGRLLTYRVGSGDRAARDRIVAALWGTGGPIELVDENGTSPPGRRRPRDALAATRIGAVPGRTLRSRPPPTVTAGEIANLQRISREGSDGHFTISRGEARRVLQGEVTLAQALAEGRRRYLGAGHVAPAAPGQPY